VLDPFLAATVGLLDLLGYQARAFDGRPHFTQSDVRDEIWRARSNRRCRCGFSMRVRLVDRTVWPRTTSVPAPASTAVATFRAVAREAAELDLLRHQHALSIDGAIDLDLDVIDEVAARAVFEARARGRGHTAPVDQEAARMAVKPLTKPSDFLLLIGLPSKLSSFRSSSPPESR